jgi:PhoPQ-activated pathogenicity-related protein
MSSSRTNLQEGLSIRILEWLLVCVAMLTIPLASSGQPFTNPETALEDFVNKPDPVFTFVPLPPVDEDGFTAYAVHLTSQTWRPGEVDPSVWTHWMVIVVPDTVLTNIGLLFIDGKSNPDFPLGASEVTLAAQVAKATGSIVTVLFRIPNQPLSSAGKSYSEDELVAFSWDKAMGTGDWSWAAYLPMVKSARRAMDAVQELHAVKQFVVAGFSKRGATTWLTAVVDPRVIAIAPVVFDVLNFAPQVEQHKAAYGFFSDALEDYENFDILARVRTPEGQALRQVVDPFSYRERLALPKFLIHSTGDQFFLPDSARFYWADLPGEKHIRYIPNTDHELVDSQAALQEFLTSLVGWYLSVIAGTTRPQISWSLDATGALVVTTSPSAPLARLWQATNPTARDFRLETFGAGWTSSPLVGTSGVFKAQIQPPQQGWRGYFIEVIYPPGTPGVAFPQIYSTQVFVTPDVLPFDIADPLGDPRGMGFWKSQVAAALTGRGGAQVDAQTLASFFPFPLFNPFPLFDPARFVTSIADADAIFSRQGGNIADQALRQCLAVRLNIAAGELGWYTRVGLSGSGFLWEAWNEAHGAFLAGAPEAAKAICQAINDL